MALIQSGTSTDLLTVDSNSKAARVTLYDANGNAIGTPPFPLQVNIDSIGFGQAEDCLISADKSIYGSGIVESRHSQISANFVFSFADNNVITSITGTGSLIPSNGFGYLSTGIGITSSAKAVTASTIRYNPGREVYAIFTAAFTSPTDLNSNQRAGLYDVNNGFFVGYSGTVFGLTIRNLGVDTFISSFNGDQLDGNSNSVFTRAGTPERIDYTKKNIYRIRFGWLGAAPIKFEVMAPDGQWVTFHTIRQPNTAISSAISNPNLPITFEVNKINSDFTNLQLFTSSWDAGIVAFVTPTQNSNLDAGNSSVTVLASNAIFTGIGYDVIGYSDISVSVFSDQDGTLQLQFSTDNINWDISISYPILANVGKYIQSGPQARFFRINYINGSSAQTVFRLQTVERPEVVFNNSVQVEGEIDQGVPTTLSNAWPTKITDGANILGVLNNPIRIDPIGTTAQPVSGTIIANVGSTNGLALDNSLITIDTNIKATQPRDITDRSGRLLGVTYGSQGQQLKQTPINFNTQIEVAVGSTLIDPRQIRTLNSTDVITANVGVTGGLALDNTLTSGTARFQQYDGINIIGTQAHPIRIDPTGTTIQPVSGIITSNVGTTGGLALDTTLTNGSMITKITDGTNTATVKTANTAAVATDKALVVAISPNNTITTSNLSVSPTDTTPPADATYAGGSVTTAAPTYTNGQMSALSLTTSGALRIDGSNTTQPVNGTVVSNQGTPTSLSGAWSVKITDGANVLGTASNPIKTDPTGITTQPISGAVTANAGSGIFNVSGTITANQGGSWTIQPGNTANTTPWLTTISQGGNSAIVTGTNALKVDGSAITQPVSGVVTANAGSGTFAVSGTVISNIGTTNGLALDSSVNGLLLSQGSITSGEKGILIQGAVTAVAPTYTTAQTSPLSLTTGGLLRVDGSGVTQPISGTVTANAGSGTFTVSGAVTANQGGNWTVQPGNTANTTPWLTTVSQGGNSATVTASNALKVDGSAVTQPVSGTVTANIGTTNGLSLDTSVNGILVSQGSTTSGEKGPLIQGAVTASTPSYTTAQTSPLSLTTTGALRTDSSAVTQPVSGTVTANAGSGTFTVSGTVTANMGTTNGLALDTTLDKLTIAQSAVLGVNTQVLVGGSVTTSVPTYTTGNINPLSLTTAGALRIDGSAMTQPVSGTVTSNQGSAPWSENIIQFGGTNISTGIGASGAGIPRVTVSNDSNVLVTPPTLTKSTQGTTGFSTQDLKDAGRVVKIFQVSAVAGVTTEAMVTLTPLSDFTAGSTGTSFTVTSGKRLRLQTLVATVRATTTTAVGAVVRLRISASGAVTTGTVVAASVGIYESVAVANNSFSNWVPLPDGLELSGTMQLGISQLASATSASLDIQLIGFEY